MSHTAPSPDATSFSQFLNALTSTSRTDAVTAERERREREASDRATAFARSDEEMDRAVLEAIRDGRQTVSQIAHAVGLGIIDDVDDPMSDVADDRLHDSLWRLEESMQVRAEEFPCRASLDGGRVYTIMAVQIDGEQ